MQSFQAFLWSSTPFRIQQLAEYPQTFERSALG